MSWNLNRNLSGNLSRKAISATTVFLLTGCLVTKADLKEGRGEGESRRSNQAQVTSMQAAKAEETSRNADLEASLREMSGRIDVLENRAGQSDQGQGRSIQQLEMQVGELTKKNALLQEEMGKMEAQIQALSEQVAASAQATAARAQQERDEKPAVAGKAADKLALFEAGEEHFQKKEWRKAILNYQKYRDSQPKGKKFPEATYKMGVCFQELGMKDEAKTFYDELVAKFPSSAEARRARIRLKKLK